MASTTELSEAAENLIPVLEALSEKDRVGLARRLLAGLEGPEEDSAEVLAAWKTAIRRRVEEVKSGKATGIPAEEVDRMMLEKYP